MNLLHRTTQPVTAHLCFRELSSSDELHQLFRLRHLVYSNQGYWEASSRRFDIDSYDRHSRFVGAFYSRDKDCEQLIGGARLILAEGEPNGPVLDRMLQNAECPAPPPRRFAYTAQELMGFEQIVQFAQRSQRSLVEFGRTVIHPDWQNGKLGVRLVYAIYGLALKYGIDLGLALVPPRLVSFYSRCGCHLLSGKGSTHYTHTELAPVVVDLHALTGNQREALLAHHQLKNDGAWVVPLYDQGNRLEPLPIQEHPLFPLLRHSPDLEESTLCELDGADDLWSPGLAGQLAYLECLKQVNVESLSIRPFGEHSAALPRLAEGAARLGLHLSCRVRTDEGPLLHLAELRREFLAPLRIVLEVDALEPDLAGAEAMIQEAAALDLPLAVRLDRVSEADAESLQPLLDLALRCQVPSLCLSDSAGLLEPEGVAALVEHVRHFFLSHSTPTRLEWQGGNQRGQALANGLAAVEAGIDKLHSSLGDCDQVPTQHLLLHLHQMAGRALSGQGFRAYLSWARSNLGWVDREGLESRVRETRAQASLVSH